MPRSRIKRTERFTMNLSTEEAEMLSTLSERAGVTQADTLRGWIRAAWERDGGGRVAAGRGARGARVT